MGGTSPWTARLQELVRHGPVSYDRALAEMASLVPPGRAFRDSQRHVERTRLKDNVTNPKRFSNSEVEKDFRISSGKIRIARTAIWTQQRDGRIVVEGEGSNKTILPGPYPTGEASSRATGLPKKPPRSSPERMVPWTRAVWRLVAAGATTVGEVQRLCQPMVTRRGSRRGVVTRCIQGLAAYRRITVIGEGDSAVIERGPNFWREPPPNF